MTRGTGLLIVLVLLAISELNQAFYEVFSSYLTHLRDLTTPLFDIIS